MQQEVDDVLKKSNQEEVDAMVSNLGKTLDSIEKKGIEKGIEKKAKETAIKAISMGMDNSVVAELTGLEEEEIKIIRRSIS